MMEGSDTALSPLSLNLGTASSKRKGGSPASKAKLAGAALPGRSPVSTQLPASVSAAGAEVALRAGPRGGSPRQDAEGRQGMQPTLSQQAGMPKQAAAGMQDMQPGQGLAMSRCADGGVVLGSRHRVSPDAAASLTPSSMLETSPSAGVIAAGGSVAFGGGRGASPSFGARMTFSGRLHASPHNDTPSLADPAAAGAGSLPVPMSASSVRCRSYPKADNLPQAVLHHDEAAGVSVCLHLPSPPYALALEVGIRASGSLLGSLHVC